MGALDGVRRRWGVEVLVVLGLSLGQSAVYSVLSIINKLTRPEPLAAQTTTMNSSATPDRPWLDLAYQLAGIGFGLMPAALVLYLLWRAPGPGRGAGGPGRLIGFDPRRPWFDLLARLGGAGAIGVPGLGLYLGAKAMGLNTNVAAANLAETWWTVPVLIGWAAMNGILEEVVMLGYLLRRFDQMPLVRSRWNAGVGIVVSALVRATYHLYQGFGAFVGNLVMGLVFGVVYRRWGRVMPLVLAHTLLDIAAFVGYALLAPHLTWLR